MKLITFDRKKGYQQKFFEAKKVKPTHWSWKLAPSEEKIHRLTMNNHNLEDFTFCIFTLNRLEIVRLRCYSSRWNSETKMKTKTSICFTLRCDSYSLFAMKYSFMNAETCNENQSEVWTVFSKTYSLISYLVRAFFFNWPELMKCTHWHRLNSPHISFSIFQSNWHFTTPFIPF